MKNLQTNFLCNQHTTEIHRCTLGYPRYLKNKIKGGPQYVVSAIFLIKINKGEIRTPNPPLSANAKRFDL